MGMDLQDEGAWGWGLTCRRCLHHRFCWPDKRGKGPAGRRAPGGGGRSFQAAAVRFPGDGVVEQVDPWTEAVRVGYHAVGNDEAARAQPDRAGVYFESGQSRSLLCSAPAEGITGVFDRSITREIRK